MNIVVDLSQKDYNILKAEYDEVWDIGLPTSQPLIEVLFKIIDAYESLQEVEVDEYETTSYSGMDTSSDGTDLSVSAGDVETTDDGVG